MTEIDKIVEEYSRPAGPDVIDRMTVGRGARRLGYIRCSQCDREFYQKAAGSTCVAQQPALQRIERRPGTSGWRISESGAGPEDRRLTNDASGHGRIGIPVAGGLIQDAQ